MAEYRELPAHEQAILREGILAEFGAREWQDVVEQTMAPEDGFAPPPGGGPQVETRDNSLESLAGMGITVRKAG